jgi:hypothetical protein
LRDRIGRLRRGQNGENQKGGEKDAQRYRMVGPKNQGKPPCIHATPPKIARLILLIHLPGFGALEVLLGHTFLMAYFSDHIAMVGYQCAKNGDSTFYSPIETQVKLICVWQL